LAEVIVDFLTPLQENFYRLRSDTQKMHKILEHGAVEANKKSRETLTKLQDSIGLIPARMQPEMTVPAKEGTHS
jgi:hypothetical protein